MFEDCNEIPIEPFQGAGGGFPRFGMNELFSLAMFDHRDRSSIELCVVVAGTD